MGSEPVEELPEDLEAWVAERAAAADISRAEVVRRLMAAHRLLEEHPDRLAEADAADFGDGGPDAPDTDAAGIDELEARITDLSGRVDGLESDLDEKITDVRKRVVQVKREADAKAPADHDHPELERRMDEGFENYEEILEYLTERADDLEAEADDRGAKLRTVANAVVDLRRRVATLEGEIEKRAAVAELRETANQHGISEAACASCGESVQLGLLDEPACPHCESPFDGVEPGGWFRSNRLTVGDRPALEAGPAPADTAGQADPTDASAPRANGGDAEPSGPGGEGPAADTAEQPAAANSSGATGDGATAERDGAPDPSDAGDAPSDADGVAGAPEDDGDSFAWSKLAGEQDGTEAGPDADEEAGDR